MDVALALTTLATLLWCYAAVLVVTWFRAVGARDRREHVGHFVALLGVLVPGIALAVAVVLLGVTLGMPSVVLALAVLFPGAVVTGLQLEVNALTAPGPRSDALRLAAAVGLAALLAARG